MCLVSLQIAVTEEPDTLFQKVSLLVKGHDRAVLDSYEFFATMAAKELGIGINKVWVLKKLLKVKLPHETVAMLVVRYGASFSLTLFSVTLPQLWASQGHGEAHTPEVSAHLQKAQGPVRDEDTLPVHWGDELERGYLCLFNSISHWRRRVFMFPPSNRALFNWALCAVHAI